MEPLSDTESEPEQFPAEPVVEEQSLEKKPKRKYVKKVKVAEPANEVIEEPKPEKPKRVMSEEHKEKMRIAREKAKERRMQEKGLAKPEPITRQDTEEPKAEPEPEVKPKRKYTRKPKAEPVAEQPKEKVVEVHHHHYEEKPKKTRAKKETEPKEKAPRKPRAKKEVAEPKQVVQRIDFV